MILLSRSTGDAGLGERLARALAPRLTQAALDRAEAALSAEAVRAGIVLEREAAGDRRRLGSTDPAAVARETGTLSAEARPWLAPALALLRRRG
ncbi:hypothetical protein [Aquabacter cavernae]|uniref:hypothetical protein n=1 Tax=Aquabacter cavernae TaxID=2496029 RepID=UPI000F8DAD69|nr:hypothetical protein [Aquabacter cavernae]